MADYDDDPLVKRLVKISGKSNKEVVTLIAEAVILYESGDMAGGDFLVDMFLHKYGKREYKQ